MLLCKLMGVALTANEKNSIPKLRLHNTASRLNSYIVENHKMIRKQEKEVEKNSKDKNNKLLDGLGIKTKYVKIEKEVKVKYHADTEMLRIILRMIPIEPIHTKSFSKILHTSKRVTEDGCKFLHELNLIHRCGINKYRAK